MLTSLASLCPHRVLLCAYVCSAGLRAPSAISSVTANAAGAASTANSTAATHAAAFATTLPAAAAAHTATAALALTSTIRARHDGHRALSQLLYECYRYSVPALRERWLLQRRGQWQWQWLSILLVGNRLRGTPMSPHPF